LNNVAFLTPEGKKVLVIENDGNEAVQFTIRFHGTQATTTLAAGAVGSYVW
jgi:glucosylceramidase